MARRIAIQSQFELLTIRVADYAAQGKIHLTVEDLLADFRGCLRDYLEDVENEVRPAQKELLNEARETISFLESLPPRTTVYEFLLPRIAEG